MLLIDAKRLKMRLIAFATAIKREYLSIEAIVDTINTEDTVDAVEVVHGQWDVEVGMNDNKERICPVCKKHVKSNFWNYCPNCGAKMDGDGDG